MYKKFETIKMRLIIFICINQLQSQRKIIMIFKIFHQKAIYVHFFNNWKNAYFKDIIYYLENFK